MYKYNYKGKNIEGEIIKGTIEGTSIDSITSELSNNGIIITSITPAGKSTNIEHLLATYFKIGQPSIVDLVLFSRQMYSLTKAGVPLVEAVTVVIRSTKNEKLKVALEDLVKGVEAGHPLSVCMSHHPIVFPTLMISLVSVGENTGRLDIVFQQIAGHLQRDSETKKQMKSATRYPIIVFITIGIAIGVINLVVVPSFANFFGKFGAELPLPTKILIATSDFMVSYWYLVLFALLSAFFGWMTYINTEQGKYFWHKTKLRIPLIGNISKMALLARFSRSFALTVRTGVPLLESISVIAKSCDNVFFTEKMLSMRTSIERGETLTASAVSTNLFSPLVLQMLSIGEETGEIETLLDEAGEFYESELEYDLRQLGDAIEPILISIIAVMVLILALGVFLPMWDISQVALT